MRPGRVKILAMLLTFTFEVVAMFTIYFLYFGMVSKYGLKENTVLLGKALALIMASGFLLPIWFYKKMKSNVVCKTERDKKLYDFMYGSEKIWSLCLVLIFAAFGVFFVK